ncbi:hypothetical protein DMUE_3084 [Dictyocoela muelleri]|nr:hypothetical protein DMUE_3084 [Dictyocoela muelleri]
MGYKLASESTCRSYLLNNLAANTLVKLKEYFKNEKIFICLDESEINGIKYFNILAGLIRKPKLNYVLDVYALPANVHMDSILVNTIIRKNFDKYEIKIEDMRLVLSDAARYMIRAFKDLKKQHPDFFHVTCLAHVIHNCAMRVKGYYGSVDKCISSVKAITVKNRTISSLFSVIGILLEL